MNQFKSLASLSGANSEVIHTEWVEIELAIFQSVVVLFLVCLNGFFVASEFAIVKVRDSQLAALAGAGVKRAVKAREVVAQLDAYLSATQLGITLASLALGWVGEPFIAHMLHPVFVAMGVQSPAVITTVSFALAFGIITFLHIVLGELAPKSLAIRKPVPTTLWVSGPLRLFHRVFRPAIWLLQGTANFFLRHVFRMAPVGEHELAHSSEELRLLLAAAAKAKELTHRGADISQRALELDSLTVRDVLTPRREVVFLDTELSPEENLRRAKASRHTRFPLCREHLDTAIGLIHIKDLISLEEDPQPDLAAVKRELLTVPEMMSLERVLEVFLERRAHLALVLDEFGGAAGIITLDNVIEELVGEIQDEFDAEQSAIKRTGADAFLAQGGLSLRELRDVTGVELESSDVSTLGGYVTEQLGRLPHAGETLELGGYLVTVVKADKHWVSQLTLQKHRPHAHGD